MVEYHTIRYFKVEIKTNRRIYVIKAVCYIINAFWVFFKYIICFNDLKMFSITFIRKNAKFENNIECKTKSHSSQPHVSK